MFNWAPHPFVRITTVLVLGILTVHYWPHLLPQNKALTCAVAAPSLLYFLNWLLYRRFKSVHLLSVTGGALGLTAIFGVGVYRAVDQKEVAHPGHLGKVQGHISYVKGTVFDGPSEKENTYRIFLSAQAAKTPTGWLPVKGKVLVYVKKERCDLDIAHGDVLIIKGRPKEVQSPQNPYEFDYKAYLARQNIYHQLFTRPEGIAVMGNTSLSTIEAWTTNLRSRGAQLIREGVTSEREQEIALALTLGLREGLGTDIKQAYAASGAIHVLAISGLHVGIIYAVVLGAFGFMQKRRGGRWVFCLTLIAVLWAYALLTGLSPSVLRAVIMFSFLALAQASGRQTNVYNTLAASAFVMLFFDPSVLFSVGFQLSYLAVVGIFFFYPKLYERWTFNSMLANKLWQLTCVSLAAQLATFPLSLYYFHQFPVYFFLANLVVIPGAFLAVSAGLGLFLFQFYDPIAQLFGQLLTYSLQAMNWLIFRIEKLPYHLISEVYITGPQVLCILGAIFSTTIFLYYRKRTYFWCATLFIAVNFFLAILRQHRVDQQEKAIFYAVNQATAVDFIKGDKAVFIGSNREKGDLDYHIRPHRLASGIKDVDFVALDQEQVKPWLPLSFAGKRYLFIRRPLSHYTSERIHIDYLILCENSVNSLEEVTGLFDFENLIIDGSNSWFTTDQLISEAEQMNFCYHTTKRQGALLIEEN